MGTPFGKGKKLVRVNGSMQQYTHVLLSFAFGDQGFHVHLSPCGLKSLEMYTLCRQESKKK